ncbi:amidohydrolase [Jiangella mangrovi]|uniref:Putative amidohydrolase YtcJ n=1 Tax=Jiangella mangrovi TaxID=1524084 RepID=A0A7W9GNF1_9ACTN|nr:amidohydrolase [Jiangella mangrovi]MBB5786878.1 putative amidohydrolase YtcJ [Jiangella mangrovi]
MGAEPGRDLLLRGGRVWGAPPDADAVLVRGRRIAAVGRGEDLLSAGADVADLAGRWVLPGFTDSHTHFHRTAMLAEYFLDFAELHPADSVAALLDVVAARYAVTPEGAWIQGDNLAPAALAERRFPTRWELDAVAPDRPVLLRGTGKHVVAANSLALRLAGIDATTPDPPGGAIERDEAGEPTGVLHERAKLRLDTTRTDTVVPGLSEADRMRALAAGIARLHELGITAIHEITRTADEFADYQRLRASSGLGVRVRAYVRVVEGQASLDDLAAVGVRSGLGDDLLRFGGVKVSVDGSDEHRNAALHEDYPGHPGHRGLIRIEAAELDAVVRRAHGLGLQTAVHAIGPRAVDLALDAFAGIGDPHGVRRLRHRIEHAYLPPRPGQLETMRDLGLVLSTQPAFLEAGGDGWREIFGADAGPRFLPLRTALDLGLVVQANSDVPCARLDPLVGIRAAVRRTTRAGTHLGAAEAVTVAEAVAMYTRAPAWTAFEEDRRGAVEAGMLADLTVVSGDPVAELDTFTVDATVVDGRLVSSRFTDPTTEGASL